MAGSSGTGNAQVESGRQLGVVFYVTIAISAAFVLCGVLFTEPFGAALGALAGGITTGLGWMYMFITAFFLVVYGGSVARGWVGGEPAEVRPVEGGSALRFDGTAAREVHLRLGEPR